MTPGPSARGPLRLFLGVAIGACLGLTGWSGPVQAESPPEVVRVRVPSARVATYFPAETPLRTLAPAEFDALVAAATARPLREPGSLQRPVRVEHFARWDGTALVGWSRVTLPATAATASAWICDPWSPALLPSAEREEVARVDAAGRLLLGQPAGQGSRVVVIPWREEALANALDRSFALRLPLADVASLVLDLPAGFVPTAPAAAVSPGSRLGPIATATDGRFRWEFPGAIGWYPIQLSSPGTDPGAVDCWVGGSTRVDLNAPDANWVADWQVEFAREGPLTGLIELDAGLDLIDVVGPEVVAFRAEPATPPGGPTRVAVTWRASGSHRSRPIPLTIRGHVAAPLSGAWPVPSARLAQSHWLGGRTEVRVDPARRVVALEERAGRRVASRPTDGVPAAAYLFETDGRPGPVAEFRLDRAGADGAVEIGGTLRIGPFAPRAEVAATWTLDRGRLFDPALDWPAGWVVDRVINADRQAPVAWHGAAIAGGGTRVHLDGLALGAESRGRTATFVVSATRDEPGPIPFVGPLALPRVRPPGAGPVLLGDERWSAEVAPGWEITPTAARGLAWLDPATVAVDPAGAGEDPTATATESPLAPTAQRLAWRWWGDADTAGDVGATVHRRPIAPRPRVEDRLAATIEGGRLRLVWTWSVAGPARPDSIPFQLDLGASGAVPRWRTVDRAGTAVVEARPLDPARRAALELPASGAAAELVLNQLPPGPLTIQGEVELPWPGSGPIPLIRLAGSVEARRAVVVRVADSTRFRVDQADGLIAVGGDPAGLVEPGVEETATGDTPIRAVVGLHEPGLRVAGAWLLAEDAAGAALHVSTNPDPAPLVPGGAVAVVTEASLVSRVASGTAARHRLLLRVAAGGARTVEFQLPAGAVLDRVRRDGQATTALVIGAACRVELAPGEPTRATSTVLLDYRTTADPDGTERFHPARFLPHLAIPCLSFTWQVNVPESFAVASESPDLVATDLADLSKVAGAANPPLNPGDSAPGGTALLADLDEALANAPPVETTLGEWLIKLDAGRWPLLLDRLALGSVGWGPGSRINVPETGTARALTASAILHALGLTVEPVGATFLISTEADQRLNRRQAAGFVPTGEILGRTLFEAALARADPTDRYQTPSRWQGEPTPRAWLAAETPDRGLVATGWRSHRFAAAGWPAAATAVRVAASTPNWRPAGFAAAAVTFFLVFLRPLRRLAHRLGWRRGGLGLAVALAVTGSAADRDDRDPDGLIVALLPYDQLAAIDAAPARVILRAEDYDRLVRWARPRPLDESGLTTLIAATHRVAPPSGRSVVVESRCVVEVAGPNPASWSFPVGSSWDLTATIAGGATPLAISPDGRTASVLALPPGRSEVRFRRSVPVAAGPEGNAIEVEVGRSAFARVEVDRGEWVGPIAWFDPSAGRASEPDRLTGELGPRDRFAVRWGPPPPEVEADRPEVALTVRWDALPAGDRVLAHGTVTGKTPLRALRLGLEPGLAVVVARVPGLVGSRGTGPAERGEWLAMIDPPLPPGATFEVALWRPAPAAGTPRGGPRWDLLETRVTGVIGCRRPDDWSGRLAAPPGLGGGPIAEAEFARLAGPIPADGMAFAGAVRWPWAGLTLAPFGPEPPRRVARDQVGVEVVPGGIRFIAESTLTDRIGPLLEAEARFDGPVRLHRVDAVGLASWTQVAPNQVRLVFEGSKPIHERSIRFHGRVEAPAPEEDRVEPTWLALPWPRWVGTEATPGKLVVSSGEGLEIREGTEAVSPDPAEPSAVTAARPGRQSWTIPPGAGLLRLGWMPPPARLNVAVESDLSLDARQAVWTAAVTSEVAGGPTRTLHWRLPTAWLDGATLRTPEGESLPVVVDTRDEATFWTITCREPIWDRRTLLLRAVRPLHPGAGLDYPELAPLAEPGRGAVGGYDLSVTNLAGWGIDLAPTPSLTAIAPPREPSVLARVPGGGVSRAFRVTGDRWGLRLGLGSSQPAAAAGLASAVGRWDDAGRGTRPERVAIQMTIDSDLRAHGEADCRVEPGSAWLAVGLPDGARLVGAMVGGQPVVAVEPRAEQAGRWLIPLGNGTARQVTFHWLDPSPAANGATARSGFAALPRFDGGSVPTSVRVWTTGDRFDLELTGGRWARVTPLEESLARFERWGDEVLGAIRPGVLDPSSPGSAAILGPLTAMALELRQVRRAFRQGDVPTEPGLDAWLAVEARINGRVLEAGGGPLIERVKGRVGLAPPEFDSPQPPEPEPRRDIYRLRQIGSATAWEGVTPEDPATPTGVSVRLRAP